MNVVLISAKIEDSTDFVRQEFDYFLMVESVKSAGNKVLIKCLRYGLPNDTIYVVISILMS